MFNTNVITFTCTLLTYIIVSLCSNNCVTVWGAKTFTFLYEIVLIRLKKLKTHVNEPSKSVDMRVLNLHRKCTGCTLKVPCRLHTFTLNRVHNVAFARCSHMYYPSRKWLFLKLEVLRTQLATFRRNVSRANNLNMFVIQGR